MATQRQFICHYRGRNALFIELNEILSCGVITRLTIFHLGFPWSNSFATKIQDEHGLFDGPFMRKTQNETVICDDQNEIQKLKQGKTWIIPDIDYDHPLSKNGANVYNLYVTFYPKPTVNNIGYKFTMIHRTRNAEMNDLRLRKEIKDVKGIRFIFKNDSMPQRIHYLSFICNDQLTDSFCPADWKINKNSIFIVFDFKYESLNAITKYLRINIFEYLDDENEFFDVEYYRNSLNGEIPDIAIDNDNFVIIN